MQSTNANSRRRLWTRVLPAATLCACVVGAVACFGLGGVSFRSLDNPFSWDQPTRTVARFKAIEKETGVAGRGVSLKAGADVVTLDDWNYTAIVRGRPQPSTHD